MTQDELLDNCWAIWESRNLSDVGKETQKDRFLVVLQPSVDRASSASDRFWFAIGEKTYTVTSSDTNTIILKGDNNNARDIYQIKQGSNLLYLYPEREFEVLAQTDTPLTTTSAALKGWIRRPDRDGFPTVQIFPTASSGTELTYRYLMNDVTLEKFPSQFHNVITFGILTTLRSDLFRFDYKQRIDEMEQHYKSNRKGGYDPLPPMHIARQLARMNTLGP